MTRYVQHIEDHLDKGTFPAPVDKVHLQSKFWQGELVVFWVMESQFTWYHMTIEEYFRIAATRKVTFNDFRRITSQ
jgi:hypothetical protein